MNTFTVSTGIVPDGSVVFTLTVVIAGLSIVLGTLAFLILVFSLFGKLASKAETRKAAKSEPEKTEPLPEPPKVVKSSEFPPPPPVIESGVSPETVAAISAAVYAYEGNDVRIASVKRKKSSSGAENAWARAAAIDNTKPF